MRGVNVSNYTIDDDAPEVYYNGSPLTTVQLRVMVRRLKTIITIQNARQALDVIDGPGLEKALKGGPDESQKRQ